MQSLNKKGVSEVVTTSTLIVIALASVALASYSIFDLIKIGNLQSSPTYNCLDLTTRLTPPIRLAKACINQNGEIEALLQRSTENIQISSFSFVLPEETWACSQETCSESCEILPPGTSRNYFLSPQSSPEDKILEIYVGTCKITEVRLTQC